MCVCDIFLYIYIYVIYNNTYRDLQVPFSRIMTGLPHLGQSRGVMGNRSMRTLAEPFLTRDVPRICMTLCTNPHVDPSSDIVGFLLHHPFPHVGSGFSQMLPRQITKIDSQEKNLKKTSPCVSVVVFPLCFSKRMTNEQTNKQTNK